ncbi:MAG: threonylcarbamoyl-AMP synthase [Anaerolineaceae bacterium 4572_5.2]|nr:MAG: threonylcarbamoyl-AMP synthase [Anaerolineaceae bacterium 4572_5.2]
MTKLIPANDPHSLVLAAKLLRQGEVVTMPTDTVYGVGALAFNAEAVAKIYAVKERPADKAIPVFVASVDALGRVCSDVSPDILPLLEQCWPGALTIILPASPALPGIVTNYSATVAVRIPNHPVALNLLALLKEPLAVTSANLSGQPPPSTPAEIKTQLEGRVPLILDDGPRPGGIPSTILDLTQSPPKILRQGAVQIASRWLKA